MKSPGFISVRSPFTAVYAPLPSTVNARHPPRYHPIKWREFRARRAAGDYANGREYAEISQYAKT